MEQTGIGYGRTIHGQKTTLKNKSIGCYAEINCGPFTNRDYNKVLATVRDEMVKSGVTDINIHGGLNRAKSGIAVPGFEKLGIKEDPDVISDFRSVLKIYKEIGAHIVVSGAEPRLPGNFLKEYPEASNVSNGILWHYFESMVEELYRKYPEVDCIQFHLFETDDVNDQDVFRNFRWAGDGLYYDPVNNIHPVYRMPLQYYSIADYFTELFAAFSSGCQQMGKEFSLLTFCHYPDQEKVVVEALKNLDPGFPVTLDHKCQPGDWSPFRPMNNVLLQVKDKGPSKMKFDGVGEYWGQGNMPYCYPEEIQGRLIYALSQNRTISSIGMRIGWGNYYSLFGTPSEINWYALLRLAENPCTPVEDIWNDWAEENFGKAAAQSVIRALRRTNTIMNLTGYIKGAWAHEHSKMATLKYFLAQILHTGRAQMEWAPQNFEDNVFLCGLLNDPREYHIQELINDRREALRLCNLSIADIDNAKNTMDEKKYQMLATQMDNMKRFIEMSIIHVEACTRAWMQKQNPSSSNLIRIEKPLAALASLAEEIDEGKAGKHFSYDSESIRKLIEEIRAYLAAF